MYKTAIIGSGVIGSLVARALSEYEVSIVVLEKENDSAMGQSKANSGIVHAGYDPVPGSLKAVLNVRGSEMMQELCEKLDVKYRKNGTLVLGFDDDDMQKLESLLHRGIKNGVKGLEIIDGNRVRKMEPHLSEKIKGALYAPTGAVVCPYELTLHALGNAMDNGAEFVTGFEVAGITDTDNGFVITGADGREITADCVINCAGVHSDEIASMAGDNSFKVTARKGEYLLVDKEMKDMVNMTIFRTPTMMGKGVLATRTVDGNILLGPTSEDIEDKENRETTRKGLESVIKREKEFFESIPLDKVITQFTGLRAHGDKGDFIINSPKERFINVAGIESPGLSSAPAIAEMVREMTADMGILGEKKADWNPCYEGITRFNELNDEEKNLLISKNSSYGRVVCRCEEVTEGEIIEAITKNPPARDIDGVKRRTRAGMGRCQGGFCMTAVAEILARELDVPFEEVTKSGGESVITYGKTKKGGTI